MYHRRMKTRFACWLAKHLPQWLWERMPLRWQAWALQAYIDNFLGEYGALVVQVTGRNHEEWQ